MFRTFFSCFRWKAFIFSSSVRVSAHVLQYENPKVEDQEGKLASNPNDILDIVSSHFKSKFEDEKIEEITPFEGEPKPLKIQ